MAAMRCVSNAFGATVVATSPRSCLCSWWRNLRSVWAECGQLLLVMVTRKGAGPGDIHPIGSGGGHGPTERNMGPWRFGADPPDASKQVRVRGPANWGWVTSGGASWLSEWTGAHRASYWGHH